MKKKYFLFFSILYFSTGAFAQFTKYVVRFKDKVGTPFSIGSPLQFLSQKAIDRRTKQKISIDSTDLPITPAYIDSVRLSGNVTILDVSKWLNQVCIATTDSAALQKINNFSFVIKADPVKRIAHLQSPQKNKYIEAIDSTASSQTVSNVLDYYNYGKSYNQIHIHNGEFLHNKGFHGEGMLMAILDAGFYEYLTLPAFDSVNANNQVIETYDYVNNKISVNEEHVHGMECFSIIGGNIPGQLVGSCPKANFYLYKTEDVTSESPVEEQYWAAAAERADSIGVDVISTSLGYNQFDNPVFDHTYADMNGQTTIAARAASFAEKKGMIVVVAAGNEGSDSWHYITTPADADSVIAVGAVDVNGNPASFSSYGPSSDGRVKPEVASVGVAAAIESTDGSVTTGNGTSFATPNMAGLITCLWQAFPEFTNMQIRLAVEKSSSIYTAPNNRIGYGIPDFEIAYNDLAQQRALNDTNAVLGKDWIKAYPNPFSKMFSVTINPPNTATATFKLYDAAGKLYLSRQESVQKNITQVIQFNNLQPLAKGMYILKYDDGQSKKSIKLLVQ